MKNNLENDGNEHRLKSELVKKCLVVGYGLKVFTATHYNPVANKVWVDDFLNDGRWISKRGVIIL